MFYFLLDFRFGGVPQFTVPRVLCCVVLVVCLCVRPVSLLTVRTFSEYCCHILGARGASRADAACGGHAQRMFWFLLDFRFLLDCLPQFTDSSYSKGTRAHTHRELI